VVVEGQGGGRHAPAADRLLDDVDEEVRRRFSIPLSQLPQPLIEFRGESHLEVLDVTNRGCRQLQE
jgi:hypothetical protein